MSTPNFIAGGTINPSTFVQITDSNTVSAASAVTQALIGIAQEWSAAAPIDGASTAAATVGKQIKVYGLGDCCLLTATSAGWTAGAFLTSDSNGNGVTASGTNYYGAIALTTLTGAGLGRVQVVIGKNP